MTTIPHATDEDAGYASLADEISKAREAYLDAIGRGPGGEVEKRALAELLWNDKCTIIDALRLAALRAPPHSLPHSGEPVAVTSSIDYQQQRGAAWDIIDEALNTYNEWMRDDDYAFSEILKKIMGRLQERRALYAPPPATQIGGGVDDTELRDLPLTWKCRANALAILRRNRGTPDDLTLGHIEALEDCEKELRAALAVPKPQRSVAREITGEALDPFAVEIAAYARDLRRNSSGGDDYPWEIMRVVADNLDAILNRYQK